MTYVDDGEGGMICVDCSVGQCPSDCRAEHCRCGCRSPLDVRTRAQQAYERALEQDRPDVALANIARDIEGERHDAGALTTERFGRPTRRAA